MDGQTPRGAVIGTTATGLYAAHATQRIRVRDSGVGSPGGLSWSSGRLSVTGRVKAKTSVLSGDRDPETTVPCELQTDVLHSSS